MIGILLGFYEGSVQYEKFKEAPNCVMFSDLISDSSEEEKVGGGDNDGDNYTTSISSTFRNDSATSTTSVGNVHGRVGDGSDSGDSKVERTSEQRQVINVVATAYVATCKGCIGITKTGVDVRNTTHYEGLRVIAVDPSVIPLGSKVFVKLPNGTTFEATAQDIGGAIKGNRIDVLVSNVDKAMNFGRQKGVEVTILQ